MTAPGCRGQTGCCILAGPNRSTVLPKVGRPARERREWFGDFGLPTLGIFFFKSQTMPEIKAIETLYDGYRFRSRLEARWAVFFDHLDLKWDYEPEGFETKAGWYLPDFRLRYPEGEVWWAEVKPYLPSDGTGEWDRMLSFSKSVKGHLLILDGTPAEKMYWTMDMIAGRVNRLGDPAGDDFGDPQRDDRYGYALSSYKSRPWHDEHSNFWGPDDLIVRGPELDLAVAAARGARFEHGERP